MEQDEQRDERICPVCETPLPDDPGVRRCPRCGARALPWTRGRSLELSVVLFNARLAGIMAGAFVAMLGLLVLGYSIPIPWGVALAALALPVLGYIVFGGVARIIPSSWRVDYMAAMLTLNIALLVAVIAGIIGLTNPMTLIGIAALTAIVSWRFIRRVVGDSAYARQE